MQEMYDGVPVVGESVVLELDNDGHYTGQVSGRLLEGIRENIPSVVPAFSKEQALEKALASSGDKRSEIQFDPNKDVVLQLDVTGKEYVRPRLVYQVNYRIENQHTLKRPFFTIDANSGRVLGKWNGITTANWRHRSKRKANPIAEYELVEGVGGNEKIGKHLYGLDLPELRVSTTPNGECVLENQYALVYNCNNSYGCDYNEAEPHHFNCTEGNNDTVNEAFSPLNDAFFYVGITYDMYADWYEISDVLQNKDVNGGRCITRVHFGSYYENAFWDGNCITFGDGQSMMYPLTSMNVVAHEISHGFTEVNSGLIYAGESGGMNEAFSDMAGEAAEDYLMHKIDWMVGFAIWKKKNESMRYFDDPPKDGRSIDHYDDFCFDMDPHLSSGIYNKAFYILSNRPGWCVRKAFHIFVVANDLYWKPSSDFHDAACDAQRAAEDLGYNVNDVTYAFRQVGIEPCSKKHSNALGSPVMLTNDTAISFKLVNALDDELSDTYMDLNLQAMASESFTLTVKTEEFTYIVKPSEEGYHQNSLSMHLGRQCLNSECIFTVKMDVEGMFMLIPIVPFQTLVAGVNLPPRSGSSDTNTTHLTVAFELPEFILKNGLRAIFVATSQSNSHNTYYIRHELPPNMDSYEYDTNGQLNRDPVMICKPREGTYYLTVAPDSSDEVVSLRIQLGIWMKGVEYTEEPSATESY